MEHFRGSFHNTKKSTCHAVFGKQMLFSWATRIRTLKMTESESVALPFGDSPLLCFSVVPRDKIYTNTCLYVLQVLFSIFFNFFEVLFQLFLIPFSPVQRQENSSPVSEQASPHKPGFTRVSRRISSGKYTASPFAPAFRW